MPAIQAARESGRSTHCKNNLHQLGIAYQGLAAKQPGEPAIGATSRWISNLLPMAEKAQGILWCPNDKSTRKSNASAAIAEDGNIIVEDKPPPSLVLHQTENSRVVLYQERQDFTLPASVSVDLSAAGTMMSNGTLSGGTVPAGTPADVWLLHYDPPGPNGTQSNARITFAGRILGVIVLTGKLRQTDASLGSPNTTYDQQQGARGMEPGAEIMTISEDMRTLTTDRLVVSGVMEEARIITEPGGVGMSSYGANGRLHRFTAGYSHKVLLVEYNKIVASVVGTGAYDVWTEQIAPRHGGTANVLFGDGHVEARTPRSIDPRVRVDPRRVVVPDPGFGAVEIYRRLAGIVRRTNWQGGCVGFVEPRAFCVTWLYVSDSERFDAIGDAIG